MRQILIFAVALMLFLSFKDAFAQLKPAQAQYLKQVGALINPAFEQGYKGWTITGCTKSREADVPFLNRTLKLTCVGETFSVRQEVDLSPFEDQQGVLNVQVKSTSNFINIATLSDGVISSNVEIQAGGYRNQSIAFRITGTSNGVEIYSSQPITGDVYIDEVSLQLAPDLIKNITAVPVGTVMPFAGGKLPADYEIADGACLSKTTYPELFNTLGTAHGECDAGTGVGSGFNKPDLRGKFIRGVADGSTSDPDRNSRGACASGGNTGDALGTCQSDAIRNITGTSAIGEFAEFRQTGAFDQRISYSHGGTNGTSAGGSTDFYTTFDASRVVPTASDNRPINVSLFYIIKVRGTLGATVVSQNFEYTAATYPAPITIRIADTGVVLDDPWGIVQSPCSISGGNVSCTYTPGIYTHPPGVTCTSSNQSGSTSSNCEYQAVSDETFFQVKNEQLNGGTFSSVPPIMTVTVTKMGADIVRSATVIGKFENINSSDLVFVKARAISGTTTNGSFDFNYVNNVTELIDNYNALTLDGDIRFIVPAGKSGKYDIGFGSRMDTNAAVSSFECGLTITSSTQLSRAVVRSSNTGNIHYLKCDFDELDLQEGDMVRFYHRKGGTATLFWNTDSRFSYLSVEQSADYEAIVANMNDAVDKCQVKFLSANFSPASFSSNASTNFSNLTIGKKYKACAQVRASGTATVGDNLGGTFQQSGVNLGKVTFYKQNNGEVFTGRGCTYAFTAISTDLELFYDTATSGNFYQGGTDANSTYAELCELNNTISTQEF